MRELEKYKDQIIENIKDVPGLINLDQSSRQGKPEITVTPKRTALAESGISVQEIALTVRAAIQGITASKYREEGDEYDITITMKDEAVDTPEKIGRISIPSRNGVMYRLSQLADIS